MKLKGSVICLAALILLAACGSGSDSPQSSGAQPPGTANSPPVISGQPATSVGAGQAYSFQPTASDADGDALQFTASNLPLWATFSASNGRLTGTPSAADVGTYNGVTISVSDGKATISLAPFSISVTQIATGSATLSWTPPTQNTDGSQLTNLAGYRILYGQSSSNLNQSVSITNPAINTYVLDNLSPGSWFFALITVNSQGVESVLSNVASKTI